MKWSINEEIKYAMKLQAAIETKKLAKWMSKAFNKRVPKHPI